MKADSTGRPVIVLNRPEYRREVEHGLRFWEAAGVGVNVDSPADLDAAIVRAVEDPPDVAAAREAALDIVYSPRSGGAAIAAAAIVDWATGLEFKPLPFGRRQARTQIQNFRSARAMRPIA